MSLLRLIAPLLVASVMTLAACGSSGGVAADPKAPSTAGRFVLAIESAETADEGRNCSLGVRARNGTFVGALNVQAAWMAHTEGFGIISDYQMIGDFAVGEERSIRLSIVGAPCTAVRRLKLTRAVCVVAPAQDPPESCADLVMLDGGGILTVER